MKVTNLATHRVATIDASLPIAAAALAMRNNHVGALVVTSGDDDRPRPIGIITDRDIVVSVVALGLDPNAIAAADIMSEQLFSADPEDDAYATIRKMRVLGVRRAPVINAKGKLSGMFTMDDFIAFLAREMGEVSSLIAAEQLEEQTTRFACE
ncbi:MAG: CBS domain-containing protein [Acidobacteria bacterium]|nr:CBS domain-containing protein [Acidobacteriota bacterium]